MEYTYRFSNGPVEMNKLMDEYYNLDRTRKFCYECPSFNKNWSCPDYDFEEKEWLNRYRYVYLIGKEYHIPREDRQKVIGVAKVGDYALRAMKVLKVSAFKDLIALEKKVPNSMALMPGNCIVCEITEDQKCTKELGDEPCRHPEVLRFSLESLGFDVDSIMKFEIGLYLQWPKEGRLPEKLCGVMALMTQEPIDMEIIKEHFPDTKKDWRMTTLANADKPEIKRAESWLENLESKNEEKDESEPLYQTQSQWIGYKSELLESENTPWKEQQADVEAQGETTESTDTKAEETEGLFKDDSSLDDGAPQVEDSEDIKESENETKPKSEAIEAVTEANCNDEDEEGEKKYKWLGFKSDILEEDIESKWK